MIQNPLRTRLKLYAPTLACAAFSLLPLLPSRASALSFALFGLLPASLSVVLVVVCGSPSFVVLACFVGVACFLFGWVCLVFLCVGGFWLFSLFRVLRLLASPYVSLCWDIRIFCFHLRH